MLGAGGGGWGLCRLFPVGEGGGVSWVEEGGGRERVGVGEGMGGGGGGGGWGGGRGMGWERGGWEGGGDIRLGGRERWCR